MERGLLHRLFSSLPIIGPAMGLFIEHTEMGIAQYGRSFGLLRGVVLGLVLMGSVIGVSEGVLVGFEIARNWITLHYTARVLANQRVDAVQEVVDNDLKECIHRDSATFANEDVSFYRVENFTPVTINGSAFTADDLMELDPHVFERDIKVLDKRVMLSPFFKEGDGKKTLATITRTQTGGIYAVASFDQTLMLIPLDQYKAVGLPTMFSSPVTQRKPVAGSGGLTVETVQQEPEPKPVRDILHAATINDGVPFVGSYSSRWTYEELPKDERETQRLKHMTRWFHEGGAAGRGDTEPLPVGTEYMPLTSKLGDPTSLVVVDGGEEEFILVAVVLHNNMGADTRFGLIPKSEYDLFVERNGK